MTFNLFNAALALVSPEQFKEIMVEALFSKKLQAKMILYHKMVTETPSSLDRLFTKDLDLIVHLLDFIGYIGSDSESINQALINSMEQSEAEDTEGQYLQWCNTTLKIKKVFDILGNYEIQIQKDDILIDDTRIWVYLRDTSELNN